MQLLVAIFMAIIVYSVSQKSYQKWWDKGLLVSLRFRDEHLEIGEKSELIEVVSNEKRLPLPVLHLKFSVSRKLLFDDKINSSVTDSYHRNEVFCVMGYERVVRKLSFEARQRGYYKIDSLNIVARDFFMTKNYAAKIKNNSETYVFPEKIKNTLCDELFARFYEEMFYSKSLVQDPFSFRGIREYTHRDEMKHINWKKTAACNTLVVNTYNPTAGKKVTILLNLEPNYMVKPEVIREISISLASTMAMMYLQKSIPVRLLSNGCDVYSRERSCVDFGSRADYMQMVDKCLARIDGNMGIDEFDKILSGVVNEENDDNTYLVISSYCKDELLVKLDYMVCRGKSVHMICPYYDIHGLDKKRDYISGWEVEYRET